MHDLDIATECRFCNKKNPIKKWRCGCGKPWHLCDVHGKHQTHDVSVDQVQPRASPQVTKKRKCTISIEELEKRERQNVRLKTVPKNIVIGNRGEGLQSPPKLGPKMMAKFGYLFKAERGSAA